MVVHAAQHHTLVQLDACGSASVRCISTTAHLSTFWGAPLFGGLVESRLRSTGDAGWPCGSGSKAPMSAWSASITASISRFLDAHAPKDGPVALRSTMWRCSELTEQCGSVIRKTSGRSKHIVSTRRRASQGSTDLLTVTHELTYLRRTAVEEEADVLQVAHRICLQRPADLYG